MLGHLCMGASQEARTPPHLANPFYVFSQLIFTYGVLMYRLMGASAQEKFTRTWAIGVGIGQATQFRELFLAAAQAAAVLLLLDVLRLTGDAAWLESHADTVCVAQSALCARQGSSRLQRLRAYTDFFRCVRASIMCVCVACAASRLTPNAQRRDTVSGFSRRAPRRRARHHRAVPTHGLVRWRSSALERGPRRCTVARLTRAPAGGW
jgi:hypothetical protein